MNKITSLFVAFGIVASLAAAGEGEGCPACKASASNPTALATARKAIAEAAKAEEKLTADQRAELKTARDFLDTTAFAKAMGPSFEACGLLTIAASQQPGTSPEAAALLKDMAMTYCSIAKMFGGCAECECCEETGECCKACKDMTPEALTKKATDSLESSRKLIAAAKAECDKMTPEQKQKVEASLQTMMKLSSHMSALGGATKALNDGFASLAKMGIPSTDGKGAIDGLVKGAIEIHGNMTSCDSGEECQECEGCGDAEETEEGETPQKSS